MFNSTRSARWLGAIVMAVAVSLTGCASTRRAAEHAGMTWYLEIDGRVTVNGRPVRVTSVGTYDRRTGSYELNKVAPSDNNLDLREKLLLSFIPRVALAFCGANGSISLVERAKGEVRVDLTGRRKVDEFSTIHAHLRITRTKDRLLVRYDGAITTVADRPIERDGEAVIRLGVNPEKGSFVGVARINYDVSQPDSAQLGTADFWNFSGRFEGVRALATETYAHVDHCGGDPRSGLAKGVILHFPSSTVFKPGIITLSGVATKDGVIHQYFGIANLAGGGHTVLTFPVHIKKGMTASQVATLIADEFNRFRALNAYPGSKYVLAVQGGDGVAELRPDPNSSRVAVSMTIDGGKSIAAPNDLRANRVFRDGAVQGFADQAVNAAENTGIRNQFGVLGQAPLTGWLTPFKIVLSTDNPGTQYRSAGGEIAVLLNWTESLPGRDQLPGSTTDFEDLVLATHKGESAEEIVARLTEKLKQRRTRWGTRPFIQRDGNVLYIDAGIDFPHTVSVASRDEGVGYMSAAADLPFFVIDR